MAQGEFTKEEAVEEMFEGLSKKKQGDFLGHLNDIQMFLSAAQKAAPEE